MSKAADPVAEMRERARELCSCLGLTRLRDGDWVVDEEIVDRMVEFAQAELLRRLGASGVDVEREECAKAVCIACRTGARLCRTTSGDVAHEEGYCAAAAIHARKHIAQPAAQTPQVLTDEVIDFNHEHERGFVPEMLDED